MRDALEVRVSSWRRCISNKEKELKIIKWKMKNGFQRFKIRLSRKEDLGRGPGIKQKRKVFI